MDIFADRNPKFVEKGRLLLRSGEICKYVTKGCLKSYVIDKAGKEHIIQFAPEGWAISDLDSFTNHKPSAVFIEAIEDSEVGYIDANSFAITMETDKELLVEISNKLRNSLIASNRRLISMLSATAEEHYIDFIQTYPALVHRLSLKLIASYIGITPEYLSEIRRKIAGK